MNLRPRIGDPILVEGIVGKNDVALSAGIVTQVVSADDDGQRCVVAATVFPNLYPMMCVHDLPLYATADAGLVALVQWREDHPGEKGFLYGYPNPPVVEILPVSSARFSEKAQQVPALPAHTSYDDEAPARFSEKAEQIDPEIKALLTDTNKG